MSHTVCLSANIRHKTNAGGAAWLYLTWALGLQSVGCRVIWLETTQFDAATPEREIADFVGIIKERLAHHGMRTFDVAMSSYSGEPLPWDASGHYLTLDESASQSDLFVNLGYHNDPRVVGRFRKSAFIDTDPGVVQTWIESGKWSMAPHDLYFTISETLGTDEARFPDCGLDWHHAPHPVHLPAWPEVPAPAAAPYTTVSNWWSEGEWIEFEGELLSNEKRMAFLDYLQLPLMTPAKLELALTLNAGPADHNERRMLSRNGWRIRSLSQDVRWTPEDYEAYVRASRGEFSCAKPFYVLLNTSWLADRTLHYLASGKPAVIQHTGPSEILPDADGVFRFKTFQEAIAALSEVEKNYERHARQARALAEEHFAADKVIGKVLERAL